SKNGVKCIFQKDKREYKSKDGRKQFRGLSDLEGGIELKRSDTSRNAYGAAQNHIENVLENKEGVKIIIFDNHGITNFTDEELTDGILNFLNDIDVYIPQKIYLIEKKTELLKKIK
ncbi:MAG: hypothetical protein IJV62_01230, partial [Eggerthellaceae bacterium]|nr:hypothetical protein [Eggerthellaceae bacterium]